MHFRVSGSIQQNMFCISAFRSFFILASAHAVTEYLAEYLIETQARAATWTRLRCDGVFSN